MPLISNTRFAANGSLIAKPRRWRSRGRLILFGIGLFLLVVVWWFSAYPRGMIEAYTDHSGGQYKVKVYGGPPAPWVGDYYRLLRERHGVELDSVGTCTVTADLMRYADGYNSVSKPRIQARFGKDIFHECGMEAWFGWLGRSCAVAVSRIP